MLMPRKKGRESNNENDSLSILIACWEHRGEHQTQRKIAEWCGLYQQRISEIINSEEKWGHNDSVLAITAEKYGFKYKLYKKRGLIIDVVYEGRK